MVVSSLKGDKVVLPYWSLMDVAIIESLNHISDEEEKIINNALLSFLNQQKLILVSIFGHAIKGCGTYNKAYLLKQLKASIVLLTKSNNHPL